jgi:hypothetical protein
VGATEIARVYVYAYYIPSPSRFKSDNPRRSQFVTRISVMMVVPTSSKTKSNNSLVRNKPNSDYFSFYSLAYSSGSLVASGDSGVRVELFRATASPTALTEPGECYHHYPRLI